MTAPDAGSKPRKARGETKRVNFTKATLAKLSPPDTGRYYCYDTRTPGLAVCVTASGVKTFYVCRRGVNGPVRVRVGTHPELSPEQARRAATTIIADIATGHDPLAERRAARERLTFRELFNHWLEVHAKPHKRTWQEDQRQFDVYLKAWHARDLKAITPTHVQGLHVRIGRDSGHYQANRVLSMVSTLFNFAIRDGWPRPNPAAGVRRFKEQSRERFMDGDELRRFFEAVAAEPDSTWRDFFLVELLTGARAANVMGMAWDAIDLAGGIWTIPAAEAKGGVPMTVVLAPQVIAILEQRRATVEGAWVFPSPRSRGGHITNANVPWRRVMTRAGIADLRQHDMRRTLGSWQAAGGTSLNIIGKSLGHKDVKTTQIYARLNLDPVRQSVGLAVDAMMANVPDDGKRLPPAPTT